jgi:hypothetical protein
MTQRRAGAALLAILAVFAACQSHDTVTPPPNSAAGSIAIKADSTALPVGATLPLAAIVRDTLGAPDSESVTWSSSNKSVATISTSGLVTGVATGSTTITAAVGTLSATVNITVTPSAPLRLVVTPGARSASATVGTPAPDDNASITLTGDVAGKSVWTASSRHAWTSLTTATGTGSGAAAWTRNTAGLAIGTYVDTITITASGATGSPATILDTLRVVAAPSVLTLLVSPVSRSVVIRWGDSAPAGTAIVTVAGPIVGEASINASDHFFRGWTGPPTLNGTLLSWAHTAAGLPVGTYVDTITVTAGIPNGGPTAAGSPARIYDTLVIAPGPGPLTLAVNPIARSASVPLGASAPSDNAAVTLSGKNANSTTWTAAKTASWVTLTTPSGIGSGTVAWRRNGGNLPAGIYYDTITVSIGGGVAPPVVIFDTLRVVGPAPVGPVTMSPTTGWAGSPVTLHSQAFRNRGAGALLHFGAASTELARVDDTTLSARIPLNASGGSVTPTFELDGYSVPLSTVTVYGNGGVQILPLQPATNAYAWSRAGHAVLVAGTVTCPAQCQGGLALFDLDARTVLSTLGGLNPWACLRDPGPSYLDSVFVVCGTSDSLEAWRLLPAPARLATNPSGISWDAIQLGPTQWLLASKYQITTPAVTVSTFQPQGVHMSPRHDRATLRTLGLGGGPCFCTQLAGIPVFAVPSGDVAYLVSQLRASEGVDFSPDGDLLAMVGGVTGYVSDSDRVLLMRASTGEVLADTTLYKRGVFAVAIDPYRPLLYVGLSGGAKPTVLVLDRTTFRVLGEMQAVDAEPTGSCCFFGVIAVNSQDALYVWGGNQSTSVWRFTLPPVQAGIRRHR